MYLAAARGQLGARVGAGREALLWPKPFEWDAESDFTAWDSGDGAAGDVGHTGEDNAARCCRAGASVSVRLAVRLWAGRCCVRECSEVSKGGVQFGQEPLGPV